MNKKLILIVEDEPDIGEVTRLALEDILDVSTELVGDGISAIDRARGAQPDLILLDLTIPKLDGLEVIRQLRADAVTRSIPILALTGLSSVDARRLVSESGFDGYIEKPFDLDHLASTVQQHLADRTLAEG